MGTSLDAIARRELQVWQQAKVSLASGEVAGTEALLRWKHPPRGMVTRGAAGGAQPPGSVSNLPRCSRS